MIFHQGNNGCVFLKHHCGVTQVDRDDTLWEWIGFTMLVQRGSGSSPYRHGEKKQMWRRCRPWSGQMVILAATLSPNGRAASQLSLRPDPHLLPGAGAASAARLESGGTTALCRQKNTEDLKDVNKIPSHTGKLQQ